MKPGDWPAYNLFFLLNQEILFTMKFNLEEKVPEFTVRGFQQVILEHDMLSCLLDLLALIVKTWNKFEWNNSFLECADLSNAHLRSQRIEKKSFLSPSLREKLSWVNSEA